MLSTMYTMEVFQKVFVAYVSVICWMFVTSMVL